LVITAPWTAQRPIYSTFGARDKTVIKSSEKLELSVVCGRHCRPLTARGDSQPCSIFDQSIWLKFFSKVEFENDSCNGCLIVGKGYKTTMENGMIKYTSKDGTKSFRIMTKKMKGVYEANFELFDKIGNKLTDYHVGIIEN